MEQLATAVIVHSIDEIEVFRIRITEEKHKIIRCRLEAERLKIIDILKKLYDDEQIKSVKKPKNKKIQIKLNNLVKAKQTIDKTIKFIKQMYK